MLPLRSKNPPESLPIATMVLIGLNLLVFALTVDPSLHIRAEVAQNYALSLGHISPVTLLAHLFLHENLLHVFGNMWFLYLFGFAVEGRLRALKFLLIYLGAGLFASLVQLIFFGGHGVYLLGASGAIMGVLGAALYLFPFGQVQFISGFGPASWQLSNWNMISVAIYYVGMDVLFIFVEGGSSSVAHLAHIAGALAGFGICAAMRPVRDSQRASEAKAMLHEVGDRSMLASSELAAMAVNAPKDTNLILNWMQRNIRDGSVKADCMDAFLSLLPRIIQKEPAPSVGFVLISLLAIDTPIASSHLLKVAHSLEVSDEGAMAKRLYDAVLRDANSSSSDLELALFRTGFIFEKLHEPKEAARSYGELIERFPMSAMAGQAQHRIEQLPFSR